MREILYCIYKDSGYEVLIYTSIAELFLKKQIKFAGDKIKIFDHSQISKFEKKVLKKIDLTKKNNCNNVNIKDWAEYLITDCINKKYLRIGLFQPVITRRFKKEVKTFLKNGFNESIINYINHKDINYLSEISNIIPQMSFAPKAPPGNTFPFSKDPLDIINEAAANRLGVFRHWTKG